MAGKREMAEIYLLAKYHPQPLERRAALLRRIINRLPKLNASQLDALLVAHSELLYSLAELDVWLRDEIKSPRCHALDVKQIVSSRRWVKLNS